MAIDRNFVIYSTPNVYSTARIISSFISLSAVHHYRVYYELTMACSPDGLTSLTKRALRPVIANVRVLFLVKPNFFRFFFNRLGCLFNCVDHFHFHYYSLVNTTRPLYLPFNWGGRHVLAFIKSNNSTSHMYVKKIKCLEMFQEEGYMKETIIYKRLFLGRLSQQNRLPDEVRKAKCITTSWRIRFTLFQNTVISYLLTFSLFIIVLFHYIESIPNISCWVGAFECLPNRLNELPKMRFEFPFNKIGKLPMAFWTCYSYSAYLNHGT